MMKWAWLSAYPAYTLSLMGSISYRTECGGVYLYSRDFRGEGKVQIFKIILGCGAS